MIEKRNFCKDCPGVKLPSSNCSTEWTPQYGKPKSDGCICLEEYKCCSEICKPINKTVCKEGQLLFNGHVS